MEEMDDIALLQEYAVRNSENAFETLVLRRAGFVYSAALRQVRDPHLAEEVTQAVFIILAQKARRLSRKTILTGWLFKTTRFAALAQTRAAAKRRQREQEAQMQTEIDRATPDAAWSQMAPILDEALASLGETDRQAILLRFFENKDLAEVGDALKASEDTARKRVTRALAKLRKYFSRRGIVSTSAMIAAGISAHSVQAAPIAMAKSVSAIAIGKGMMGTGSTLTLMKAALKLMAWTKLKVALSAAAVVILTAGTTAVIVNAAESSPPATESSPPVEDGPWQVPRVSMNVLETAAPQTRIVPSKFTAKGGWICRSSMGAIGIGQPIDAVAQIAYQLPASRIPDSLRTIVSPDLPDGRYDFISKLSYDERPHVEQLISGRWEKLSPEERNRRSRELNAASVEKWTGVLQTALKSEIGVAAHREMRVRDVLLLKVRVPNAGGIRSESIWNHLKRPHNWEELDGDYDRAGEVWFFDRPIDELVPFLEGRLQIPVIDRTGLTNSCDFCIKWPEPDRSQPNNEALKKALLDQLGLELVPSSEPIEMLIVEKAK